MSDVRAPILNGPMFRNVNARSNCSSNAGAGDWAPIDTVSVAADKRAMIPHVARLTSTILSLESSPRQFALRGIGLHLPLDHLVVEPALFHQRVVRAALDDLAVLHHQNHVSAPDRRQP